MPFLLSLNNEYENLNLDINIKQYCKDLFYKSKYQINYKVYNVQLCFNFKDIVYFVYDH